MRSVVDEQKAPGDASITELLVLWQDPDSRAMLPVAVLSFDGAIYRFRYLPAAERTPGFRPLLGFRELAKEYASDELFPLFRERVLDPTRPDFARVLEQLDLDVESASPWEQLVRTGGSSEGDTLQVTPVPRETAGGWSCRFLVAGLRYSTLKSVDTTFGTLGPVSAEAFETLLSGLTRGDELTLESELGNDYNSDAKLILRGDNVIGYLPDWLARLVAKPRTERASMRVTVQHANPAPAGWHLRLLAEIEVAEELGEAVERLKTETVGSY